MKTIQLIYVDFGNHRGVALSRDPGALVCAEFHHLTREHLAGTVGQIAADMACDGLVLYGGCAALDILDIKPAAIFQPLARSKPDE